MTHDRNQVLAIGGGLPAHVQAFLLRFGSILTGSIGYRGMQRLALQLNRFFKGGNSALIALAHGGKLRIDLNDSYWIILLAPAFVHEPEVGFVLMTALQQDKVFFIDCGANIGYWSASATAVLGDSTKVVAVEAAPPSFERLQRNSSLNDRPFQCVLGAVWSRDNEDLVIVTHKDRHAGSSVVNRREKRGQPGYAQHVVPSITLDTLCKRYLRDPTSRIVIKLDVEGAEIPALVGAGEILRHKDTLLIYEDHVQDPSSEVSRYILETLRFEVYYCGKNFRITRMAGMSSIQDVKAHIRTGFNFFACSPKSVFSRVFNRLADKAEHS